MKKLAPHNNWGRREFNYWDRDHTLASQLPPRQTRADKVRQMMEESKAREAEEDLDTNNL